MFKLTGATRFRSNWRGKLILQVEVVGRTDYGDGFYETASSWRDARTEDLASLHALHYSQIHVFLPEPKLHGEASSDGRKPH